MRDMLQRTIKFECDFGRGMVNNRVTYSETGVKGGKPIDLLPGFGYESPFYYSLIQELVSEGNRVVVPEVCGRYSFLRESPRTIDETVELYRAFSEAIGREKRVLIGHSLGGSVSLSYAAKYPENIESVIAIEPVLPTGKGVLRHILNYSWMNCQELTGKAGGTAYNYWVQQKARKILAPYLTNLMKGLQRPSLTNLHDGPQQTYFINLVKSVFKPLYLIEDIALYQFKDLKITLPTLITTGSKSELFKMDSAMVEDLKNRIPESDIRVLKGKTHNWILFNNEEATRLIIEFIQKTSK